MLKIIIKNVPITYNVKKNDLFYSYTHELFIELGLSLKTKIYVLVASIYL